MARLGPMACVFALLPLVSSQFFNPTTERQVFHVGEAVTFRYHTKLVNYTIALWQQAIAGGSASLGPAIVRVTNGPQKQFDWQVQLYSFDLESSNIFFFWLREGGIENLGANVEWMTSAYFNITDAPLPSSSSSLSSSTTSSSTTTSSTLATDLSTTHSNTQSSSSATASTHPNNTPHQQDANPTLNNNNNTPSESSSSSGETKAEGGARGGDNLPVAAQAGIGVGISIIGLTTIACGILWFRYLRKKQQILTDLQQAYARPPPDPAELWKMQAATALVPAPVPAPAQHHQHLEMDGGYRPAELGY